jgi:hypothetical protein
MLVYVRQYFYCNGAGVSIGTVAYCTMCYQPYQPDMMICTSMHRVLLYVEKEL